MRLQYQSNNRFKARHAIYFFVKAWSGENTLYTINDYLTSSKKLRPQSYRKRERDEEREREIHMIIIVTIEYQFNSNSYYHLHFKGKNYF